MQAERRRAKVELKLHSIDADVLQLEIMETPTEVADEVLADHIIQKISDENQVPESDVRQYLEGIGYKTPDDFVHVRNAQRSGAVMVNKPDEEKRLRNGQRYDYLVSALNEQLALLGQGYSQEAMTDADHLKSVIDGYIFRSALDRISHTHNQDPMYIYTSAATAAPSTRKGSEGQQNRAAEEAVRKLSLFVFYLIASNKGGGQIQEVFVDLYPDYRERLSRFLSERPITSVLSSVQRQYLSAVWDLFGPDELKAMNFPVKHPTHGEIHRYHQDLNERDKNTAGTKPAEEAFRQLSYTPGLRTTRVTPEQYAHFLREKGYDPAMYAPGQSKDLGGIDLNENMLDLQTSGQRSAFRLTQKNIENIHIDGLSAVITRVVAIKDIISFMSLSGT